MEKLSLQDQGRILTSSDLLLERSIATSSELCSVKIELPFASTRRPISTQVEKSVESIGGTHANQVVEPTKSVDNEEFIHIDDRNWKDIPACTNFQPKHLLPRSRSLLSDWYAIVTSTKEEQTAPLMGILKVPN